MCLNSLVVHQIPVRGTVDILVGTSRYWDADLVADGESPAGSMTLGHHSSYARVIPEDRRA